MTPSACVADDVLEHDPARQPTLIYPARGVAALWSDPVRVTSAGVAAVLTRIQPSAIAVWVGLGRRC
jgi:hypothetical protein